MRMSRKEREMLRITEEMRISQEEIEVSQSVLVD